MEYTDQQTKENSAVNYDAELNQRYEFEVAENGNRYDTAHILKPISDERYLAFVKSIELTESESEIAKRAKEASVKLWADLIVEVENISINENENLSEIIETDEKVKVINDFLAVAVIPAEKNAGERQGRRKEEVQTVKTEMFFSGLPVQQTHTLKATSDEWRKKFDQIQKNRFKQEKTKGLSRKAKIEYFPQDEAIANLYGEMQIETRGFENQNCPIRVKTAVIYDIFASRFDEKK